MIARLLNYLAGKPTAPRSSAWPSVERSFLAAHPSCEVCGVRSGLNVHHKKPYHLFKPLELDPTNLITLCRVNGCHFLFGHGRDWKAYNPNVDTDVVRAKEMIDKRKYAA